MIIPAAIKDKDKIYLTFQFYQKQMIQKNMKVQSVDY